jgi:uncharacterized protein GlcG (DUF336 family)
LNSRVSISWHRKHPGADIVEMKRENAMLEMPLTLAEAISIVNAAIDRAQELGANVSVAVCDGQGHLVALHHMDNTVAMANESSIGKALASAGTGLPSAQKVTASMNQSSIDLMVWCERGKP